MNTIHYATYDFVQLSCDGVPVIFRNRRYQISTNTPGEFIYMPTEMMHGLYDGGALWDLQDSAPYVNMAQTIWRICTRPLPRSLVTLSHNHLPCLTRRTARHWDSLL